MSASVKGTRLSRPMGVLYACVSAGTFGLLPLFSMSALEAGYTTQSVLFYRFAIATVIFGVMALLRGIRLRVGGRQLLELLLLGTLCYGAGAYFLIYAYQFIPTGIATTINFLYPVCVALVMRFVFGERLNVATVLAIGLSLVGVACMSWEGGGLLDLHGLGAAFITCVCYGLYIVGLSKLSVRRVPGSIVTFYVLLFCTLLFGALAMVHGGIQPLRSLPVARDMVLIAVVSTIISNLTLVLAVQSIGSIYTSVLGSLEPLTAVGVGVFLFSEQLNWLQLTGVVLVVVSVALVVIWKPRKQ